MIRISFIAREDELCGVSVSGHSGYAEAGSDIVCAAVTSAVRYAESVMNGILECKVPFVVHDESAEIEMMLGEDIPLGKFEQCLALLKGLLVYFRELEKEFPTYIDVLEV